MKNDFIAILCIILLLVKNSFGDFGCECGAFKNNQEEAAKCFEAQKILNTDINLAFNPQSRIVGGYDVKEECMKRPSLVLIRVLGLVDKGLIGYCMGSIINKNYVVSAAHCYCAGKYGECTENDGAMISGRTESGLPKYGKANLVSFADPRTATNTMVFVPGFAPSYSKSQVLELQYQATGPGVSPVDEIVIHPQFILNKRIQNDIALVKVRKPFDFSSPLKVSPICLPLPGFQDHDISAYVTGYGELFERNSCNTGLGGPEEYRPCRKYFAMNNDLFEVENACLNFASPADRDPECREFRNQHPAYTKAKALISVDGTIRTCHPPTFDGVASWCAVCVEGTKMGEPGFCPEDDQFLEIENRNDVSAHVGWGYCDKMCFQYTKANDLQEAEITALSEQECQKRSEKYLLHAETLANRPEKALELCGAKEKKYTLTTFIKVGETFIANETVSQEIWGGSDTCQGDSGGPLWTVKDGKAYLVGVTNRGTGCARKDTYGIYARVAAHRDWILLMADSGKCNA